MELFKRKKTKTKEKKYSGLITMLRHYKSTHGEKMDKYSSTLFDTLTLSRRSKLNLDNPFVKLENQKIVKHASPSGRSAKRK